MTLEELKDYIKGVCLSHVDIKDFYVGNDYNEAEDIRKVYPSVFYELPYYLQYNIPTQTNIDNIQFALNVYVESNTDDIDADHKAISKAKVIGDDILNYLNLEFIINITQVNAVSVREFTDDSVAGMRYEYIISLPQECLNINERFDIDDN
jgi:hypothetical protein